VWCGLGLPLGVHLVAPVVSLGSLRGATFGFPVYAPSVTSVVPSGCTWFPRQCHCGIRGVPLGPGWSPWVSLVALGLPWVSCVALCILFALVPLVRLGPRWSLGSRFALGFLGSGRPWVRQPWSGWLMPKAQARSSKSVSLSCLNVGFLLLVQGIPEPLPQIWNPANGPWPWLDTRILAGRKSPPNNPLDLNLWTGGAVKENYPGSHF